MNLLDIVILAIDLPERNLFKGQVGTVVEVNQFEGLGIEFITLQGKLYTFKRNEADNLLNVYCSPFSQVGLFLVS